VWRAALATDIITLPYRSSQHGQCSDYAMCWMIQGSIPSRDKKFFSLKCPGQLWHPPSLLFEGTTGSLSVHVKCLGYKVDHSPPSSAKAKND